MGKVTIRFWDKQMQRYELVCHLVTSKEGYVYQLLDSGEYDDVGLFYEPHFYKDGERIA